MLSRDLTGKSRALASVSRHPLCAVYKTEGMTSSHRKILGTCNKERKLLESPVSSRIRVPKQNAKEFTGAGEVRKLQAETRSISLFVCLFVCL